MKKPNIVLIMSEHHNASIMGNVGDEFISTPNLDKLAKNGTTLSNCYCNSPLCVPSRSSFLTGRLPSDNQVYNNQDSLNPHIPTIAHSMTVAGYETILSGRMHFWGLDQYHGFEKRLVGDTTPYFFGLNDKLNIYHSLEGAQKQGRKGLLMSGAGDSACLEFDDEVCQATVEYLENRSNEKPLFMVVGLRAVHPPYICPKEYYDKYYNLLPELDDYVVEHPALKSFLHNRDAENIPSEVRKRVRASVYGMIEYTDNIVGKIIDATAKQLGEETIFIYTADHGDSLGVNGLYWKANHLEDSVKIPCIISYKGKYDEGNTITQPTCMTDITQTILDAGEAQPLNNMFGKSLVNILKGKDELPYDREIISQLGSYPRTGDDVSAMVRKGDYKYISYYGYEKGQLFNLKEDPLERENLIDCSDYKVVADDLKDTLAKYWDAEKAHHHCVQIYKEVSLLKQWANKTNFDFPSMWRSSDKRNYLNKE